jgi:hypothetical protein
MDGKMIAPLANKTDPATAIAISVPRAIKALNPRVVTPGSIALIRVLFSPSGNQAERFECIEMRSVWRLTGTLLL